MGSGERSNRSCKMDPVYAQGVSLSKAEDSLIRGCSAEKCVGVEDKMT